MSRAVARSSRAADDQLRAGRELMILMLDRAELLMAEIVRLRAELAALKDERRP